MCYYLLLAVLVGKEVSFQNSEADMVESPGLEQGGLTDWAWEKGRNEGCPRTELSSAVTKQTGSAARVWGKVGTGSRHLPVTSLTHSQALAALAALAWSQKCERRPCSRPLPSRARRVGGYSAGAGSRAKSQRWRGRGGDGAGRGGASAPPRALFPAARWQRSVDRRSCTQRVAGHPDRSAGHGRADARTD